MRAFIHIGLGKTGTSSIQTALDESRQRLAEHGVYVPGTWHRDTRHAVYDLMGRRIQGAVNDQIPGAFNRWIAEINASPLETVVASEEMLALARPAQVKRLVEALGPREVHVIVTLRDLGSVLGSYWQQMVLMGRTETLAEFMAAVRSPETGKVAARLGFWLRQDILRILGAWETQVPRTNIRIVPLPRHDSTTLEDRFAGVLGLPPGLLYAESRDNAGLGIPESEVIRRLNEQLDGKIRENQRLNLQRLIRRALVGRGSPKVRVSRDDIEWANEQTRAWCAEFTARGYQVAGSLDELLTPVPESDPAPPTDAELAEAAQLALASVARNQAFLWMKHRQHLRETGELPDHAEEDTFGSRLRAAQFWVKTTALEKSDSNPVLGWAARQYLKRTSR